MTSTVSFEHPLFNQVEIALILDETRDVIRAVANGQGMIWKRGPSRSRKGRRGEMLDRDEIRRIGVILGKTPNWSALDAN